MVYKRKTKRYYKRRYRSGYKPRKYQRKKYTLSQKVTYLNRKLNNYMKQYTPENQLALFQVGPEDYNYQTEAVLDPDAQQYYGLGRTEQYSVIEWIKGSNPGELHFNGELCRIKKLIIYYNYQMIGFTARNNENLELRVTISMIKTATPTNYRVHNVNDLHRNGKLFLDDAVNAINGPLSDDVTSQYKIVYDRKIRLSVIKPTVRGKFVLKNIVLRRPTASYDSYKNNIIMSITSANDTYQNVASPTDLRNPLVLRDQYYVKAIYNEQDHTEHTNNRVLKCSKTEEPVESELEKNCVEHK